MRTSNNKLIKKHPMTNQYTISAVAYSKCPLKRRLHAAKIQTQPHNMVYEGGGVGGHVNSEFGSPDWTAAYKMPLISNEAV